MRLQALDPERVLARGFALLTDRDGPRRRSVDAGCVSATTLVARLHDGRLALEVLSAAPREPQSP